MHKSFTIWCVLTWWLFVQCKTTEKVNPPAIHHDEYEVVDFMQAMPKNKSEMAQQSVSSKQSELKQKKRIQHKKTINETTHTKGLQRFFFIY